MKRYRAVKRAGTVLILIMAQIAFVQFAPAAAQSVSGENFSDVPDTHPNTFAIQTLKDAGIVNGYADGTFKPDQAISRAEAVAIMLKAVGITATVTSAAVPFTDVPKEAWYFPMIQKGYAMGKLKGYPDKTFKPENAVSLPEALALTLGFFNISVTAVAIEPVIYSGLSVTDWYAAYAQYAKDKNLIEPDSSGRVDPAKFLTRGMLAEIIYRMRIIRDTGKPFDITSGWTVTEYPGNFWRMEHPAGWQIFKGARNSVIWNNTGIGIFFTRIWPASGRVTISIIENTENTGAAAFFANLKIKYSQTYETEKISFLETQINGKSALKVLIPESRVIDAALALPNNNFIIISGDYGNAPTGQYIAKQIGYIIDSYEYIEAAIEPIIPLEQRMETLRENILIENKWSEIAPKFPDKNLIFTDAIGIGTGPVDYYYSAEATTTIKLERDSGTILNIKEGRTTEF